MTRPPIEEYCNQYVRAILEGDFIHSNVILEGLEERYSSNIARQMHAEVHERFKSIVADLERHTPFLFTKEETALLADVPPEPLQLQSITTPQKNEAADTGEPEASAQGRRSAWVRPSRFRGHVPMYPWGSAWQFCCHKCGTKIRSKGHFEQHMRNYHGFTDFAVMDLHEESEVWGGLLDIADENDVIFAEMVFDEGYAAGNADTGQRPPRRLDAAYKRENGKDVKIRERRNWGDLMWMDGVYGGARYGDETMIQVPATWNDVPIENV